LTAGHLSAVLTRAELRNVRVAGHPALDAVYVAVRDASWRTVPGEVTARRTAGTRRGRSPNWRSGTGSAANAGWSGRVVDDVRTKIWKKLILNAATLPTAALTGCTAGHLADEPAMQALVDATAQQTCVVAKRLGLPIDRESHKVVHA
jgi:ketopantoate reductase